MSEKISLDSSVITYLIFTWNENNLIKPFITGNSS